MSANITVIDIESYYDRDFSLRRLTVPEYVHDGRFHEHGLAIRWPDGQSEFIANVGEALRQLTVRFGSGLERTTIVCHNAAFDLYVLSHRHGVRPRHFIDTMLLAHHVHGRRDGLHGEEASLQALAQRYGLKPKGDLDFVVGILQPDDEQWLKLTTYALGDVELTFQLALRLLPQVSRPKVELAIMQHTVKLFTERGIQVDQNGIAALVNEVREQTAGRLATASISAEDVSNNGRFAEHLGKALARTGREIPRKQGKRGLIPATAKTDAEMQALIDDQDAVVAAVARARLEHKGQDQKLSRLATLSQIATATGGFLPPYLAYCGAHTGRFAGGGGFNIQNLGRAGAGGRIRNLLLPKPGHAFIIGDFAQIEARITAWFADEQTMLEGFRESRDLYAEFAGTTFDRDVRKPRDDDTDDVKSALVGLRQVGKKSILGLGYGMGSARFMSVLRADSLTASLFHTGTLSPTKCREIVETFRQTYAKLPSFWQWLDRASRGCLGGRTAQRPGLRIHSIRGGMQLVLPSTRALRYPSLRLDTTPRMIRYLDDDGHEANFSPNQPALIYGQGVNLYGAKLCENIVQATARDLLVEAILRLETQGLPVLFHVHDEIIVELPLEAMEEGARTVEREMSVAPAWATGLPLACEVRIADNYGK